MSRMEIECGNIAARCSDGVLMSSPLAIGPNYGGGPPCHFIDAVAGPAALALVYSTTTVPSTLVSATNRSLKREVIGPH